MDTLQEQDTYLTVDLVVPSSVPALKLLCVSDTHDQQAYLPNALPQADILVHAGDFTCYGKRDEVKNFENWTQQLLDDGTVKEVVFVAGNHDISLELKAKIPAALRSQQENKRSLVERDHVTYLQDSSASVLGVRFFGSPWTTRCGRDWGFQSLDIDDPAFGLTLGEIFDQIPSEIDVLLTHQPPYGQCDSCTHGRTGSAMLLRNVERTKPALHVFGHIHTGHGVSSNGDTLFVNAAICDDDYQPIQKPILVQLIHND